MAYVAGETADADALRTALAQALPEYMVPAVIVPLESLPLNANGKVDRKALPEARQATGKREYEAPQGELEQALAQIWAEVLGVPHVGRHDGFFELGGHSLLALRLINVMKERMSVQLPLKLLFENPSLAECSRAVALQAQDASRAAADLDRMAALLDMVEA